MPFFTINDTHTTDAIAEAIVHREREIFSYDLNIVNYETALAGMPQDDWPEHLVQYQTATLDQVPDEYDAIVSEYQFRDRLRYLLKTERAERLKTFKIYEALVARLPADQIETLVAEAQARINAAQ